MIESERGWGQKLDETLYFPTPELAREFTELYNQTHNNQATVPDWYIKAELA